MGVGDRETVRTQSPVVKEPLAQGAGRGYPENPSAEKAGVLQVQAQRVVLLLEKMVLWCERCLRHRKLLEVCFHSKVNGFKRNPAGN